MARLSFLPVLTAVIQVQEAEDQTEAVPLHDLEFKGTSKYMYMYMYTCISLIPDLQSL